MEAVHHAKNAYSDGACEKMCLLYCCFCCCKQKYKNMRQKLIFKTWPTVRDADEPDNIEWENLGVNVCEQKARKCTSWILSIIILVIALGLMIGQEVAGDTVSNDFNVPYLCPLDKMKGGSITKADVWKDF